MTNQTVSAKRGKKNASKVLYEVSPVTEHDVYLFKEGNHFKLYEKLGAHPMQVKDVAGTHFALWAPNAQSVSVVGDFNNWDPCAHPLRVREDGSGIWEGFVPGIGPGVLYKYHLVSCYHNYRVNKADPFAFCSEEPPRTASRVWSLDHDWKDAEWMGARQRTNAMDAPFSVYELHLGSWRRAVEAENRSLTYQELAEQLARYVLEMGFTHVELMPVMEHPFYGSWGYQCTGYFSPTSRYGTPQDLMALVDSLHRCGIGVILDWVPSHFPTDEHGLSYFDGTHLYEHADPQKGFHPDWKSSIFNYGRNEVRSFLISSACFWLQKYHADGLRVDAVASMLYLDYSRKEGEWIPNEYGGRENIEAIHFLRRLNEAVYGTFPGVQTIAEESTAWPMVSRPTYVGGLGFGMKWMMGWMHDTLHYFAREPVYRKHHHHELTFSLWYAFTENFMLPLSHDEVVHGKGSLIDRMPGRDAWQKFSNLRLLFGFMYGHPGKKLLFMGGEFGQWREWSHEDSLDWHLLEDPQHKGVQRWVRDLNRFYRSEPSLHELDFEGQGFEWIDTQDWEQSVYSFIRKAKDPADNLLVVLNMTPVSRQNYRLGVPGGGTWMELLNSDAGDYGGSGQGNFGSLDASPLPLNGYSHSVSLTLPPLGVLYLKRQRG